MEEPQTFAKYVSGLALERETEANSNMFQASLKTLLSPSLASDLERQIRVSYKIEKKTGRSDGSAHTYNSIRRWPEVNGVVKKLEKDESLDSDKYIKENNNILEGIYFCSFGFQHIVF